VIPTPPEGEPVPPTLGGGRLGMMQRDAGPGAGGTAHRQDGGRRTEGGGGHSAFGAVGICPPPTVTLPPPNTISAQG